VVGFSFFGRGQTPGRPRHRSSVGPIWLSFRSSRP
jgi:hypothetical protein